MPKPGINRHLLDYEEEIVMANKNLLAKCNKCYRVKTCSTFEACVNCTKNDPLIKTADRKKAPSLQTYAKRVDEILPIEPAFVAVDSLGIRFFTCRPVYRADSSGDARWTTGYFEDMIAVFRYDYLEGLFDIDPYVTKNGLDFSSMIAEI